MTHIEGVLKEITRDDSGETIICKMIGYDNREYTFGVSFDEFMKKVLRNEKAGIVIYEEGDSDFVSIRGVAKSLALTAKYGNNF